MDGSDGSNVQTRGANYKDADLQALSLFSSSVDDGNTDVHSMPLTNSIARVEGTPFLGNTSAIRLTATALCKMESSVYTLSQVVLEIDQYVRMGSAPQDRA